MPSVEEHLTSVPLLSGLKPKERAALAKAMQERDFASGHEITIEGRSGVGFFVILDGKATVTVGETQRRELGPGDYFGEMALIDSGRRSATVTAADNLRCATMAPWDFKAFVQTHPDVGWVLMETLVGRLREAEAG